MDSDTAKVVGAWSLQNGRLVMDLPDDPAEHEGPTRFSVTLEEAEAAAVIAQLPTRVQDRILAVIRAHARDLADKEAGAVRDAETIESYRRTAASLAGLAEHVRAGGGS